MGGGFKKVQINITDHTFKYDLNFLQTKRLRKDSYDTFSTRESYTVNQHRK